MTRRRLLKWTARAALGSFAAGGAYGVLEARWLRLRHVALTVPRLPAPFNGITVAFLADIHHGPFVPREYVEHVVATTNALEPEIVLLGGDYVHSSPSYIANCFAALSRLEAPLGRYAVLGNHDHVHGEARSLAALDAAGLENVNNRGSWLEKQGARLRICGVDDFWRGHQDLPSALGDATHDDAVILLSHNPDYVELVRDPRVGLVLSGHTHGGQVVVPGLRPRWAPTRYGRKYLEGLCQGPTTRVFVTRGAGTTGLPIRFYCRPEIVAITLNRDTQA